MSVDVSRGGPGILLAKAQRVKQWLGRSGNVRDGNSPAPRSYLTQEQFQEELAVLDLSDQTFGPGEYADALGKYLGLTVSIDIVPDAAHPLLSRELARKGVLGETLYRADVARVQVIVPESLPPLALIFTLLHELGHLAAGDLFVDPEDADPLSERGPILPGLRVPGKARLARGLPFERIEHREHEANLRAGYAFVAGCLGSENPYAQRMYDIL